MIRVYLILAGLLLGTINLSYAQWTDNGGVMSTYDKIGLGTSNPLSELDIYKDSGGLDYMLTLSKQYRSSSSSAIGIKFLLNRIDANRFAAIVVGSNDTWGRRTYFDFYTQSGGDNTPGVRMRINHNGYVGIGTTNPTERLTVNGAIRAEEVIVVENVGADFVFDEDYKLPSLNQVEAYIKQHNHLPEIPSAKEMKKNGVKMGVLQMKLLQKIEELTLYVIGLKKKNEAQTAQIKNLKRRLHNLNKN